MVLVLSNGSVFRGKPLGAAGDTSGEVVFNTGMTGYQEILTDPSYAGQMVILTYPLIGNYGINPDDFQSEVVQPTGLIVREACEMPSNWRKSMTLDAYMKSQNLVGIQSIDTRALTQEIRSNGVLMGMITGGDPREAYEKLQSASSYDDTDFVYKVTTKTPYAWGKMGKERVDQPESTYKYRVVAIDCGLKTNILRRFASLGVRTIVVPATSTADEILGYDPDGILLSPGPGDPARLGQVVDTVKGLLGQRPIFGICLGNQLLCQALGARTYKMKFGHRGSNHPVKDLEDGTVTITSQNHGYAVDPETLAGTGLTITQLNLNDNTVEGVRHADFRAMSIQYHPEAAPGPWDSRKYFAQFVKEMETK
jgi:carbamoyl-phosphate synthase small subunit